MWIRSTESIVIAAIVAMLLAGGGAAADPVASPASVRASDPAACAGVLEAYVTTVLTGDPGQAGRFWRPGDVASADRLGISYRDVPFKVDSDSPLWLQADDLRAGRLRWRIEPPREVTGSEASAPVAATFVTSDGSSETRFIYRFAREDDLWLLASPVMLACEGAPSRSARFIRVFDDRSQATPSPADEATVAALDSCVRRFAALLELTASDRERLETGKLGYLLADAADVTRLAGAPTVGVANLQQDVVVTTHPCHAHELAHLVVNVWLSDLPLFMLPLLQEGAAVSLGGRWGRHPRVLERVGRTALADGWVTLDDLLTRDGFQSLPADLTYAPAGVFAGFIIQDFGADGLRRACLAVAGDAATLSGWDANEIQGRLARALATDWPTLEQAFERRCETPVDSGIRPGLAGLAHGGYGDGELAGHRLTVAVIDRRDTSEVGVVVRTHGGAPDGAILFGGEDAGAAANALFSEHFPGRTYRGETHALIFTRDDAKLYDYRLQMLVALHAEGFWPSESTFAQEDEAGLRFRVDRALWPSGAMALVEDRTD